MLADAATKAISITDPSKRKKGGEGEKKMKKKGTNE
jgi:hypothetical protein